MKGPMIMDRSKGWGNLCHDSIRGFHQATLSVAGWDLSLFAVDSGCFSAHFRGLGSFNSKATAAGRTVDSVTGSAVIRQNVCC